ncbi:MAG: hypothetical protein NVS2B14_00390 [Chamaesiphon sp.]
MPQPISWLNNQIDSDLPKVGASPELKPLLYTWDEYQTYDLVHIALVSNVVAQIAYQYLPVGLLPYRFTQALDPYAFDQEVNITSLFDRFRPYHFDWCNGYSLAFYNFFKKYSGTNFYGHSLAGYSADMFNPITSNSSTLGLLDTIRNTIYTSTVNPVFNYLSTQATTIGTTAINESLPLIYPGVYPVITDYTYASDRITINLPSNRTQDVIITYYFKELDQLTVDRTYIRKTTNETDLVILLENFVNCSMVVTAEPSVKTAIETQLDNLSKKFLYKHLPELLGKLDDFISATYPDIFNVLDHLNFKYNFNFSFDTASANANSSMVPDPNDISFAQPKPTTTIDTITRQCLKPKPDWYSYGCLLYANNNFWHDPIIPPADITTPIYYYDNGNGSYTASIIPRFMATPSDLIATSADNALIPNVFANSYPPPGLTGQQVSSSIYNLSTEAWKNLFPRYSSNVARLVKYPIEILNLFLAFSTGSNYSYMYASAEAIGETRGNGMSARLIEEVLILNDVQSSGVLLFERDLLVPLKTAFWSNQDEVLNSTLHHPTVSVETYIAWLDSKLYAQTGNTPLGEWDLNMPDSRTIKEIHAALGANHYAYDPVDPTKPMFANLGYRIFRTSQVVGINVKADGSVLPVSDRQIIPHGQAVPPGYYFGQWGEVDKAAENAATRNLPIDPNNPPPTDRRNGIAIELICNELVGDPNNPNGITIKRAGYALCENLPQVFQTWQEILDKALDLQNLGGSKIPNADGHGKIGVYEGLYSMMSEQLYMASTLHQALVQVYIMSLTNGEVAKEMLVALGLPLTAKTVSVDVGGTVLGKAPYPGLAGGAMSIVQLMGAILHNLGIPAGNVAK